MNEAARAQRRAVFLDRDGVLNVAPVRNGKPLSPNSLGELELLPGVREACTELKRAGFLLVVATNQPDIARRKIERAQVEAMNNHLRDELGLDDIAMCPHDDADGCACRKPKPGLLLDAAQRHGIDLARSVMVGDRWRDVEAGRGAGCRTVFIDYGYDETRPKRPDVVTTSLAAAVPDILRWSP
jgi:D-glycero-D-manno-heptose 1,7-bisphosphate phosphatase